MRGKIRRKADEFVDDICSGLPLVNFNIYWD